MSNLTDIHVKVETEDLERLKKFCLHRGDLTYLVGLAIKRFVKRLEEQSEKEDSELIHRINM